MAGQKGKGMVIVHAGAGYHAPSRAQEYMDICAQACHQATQLLQNGKTAVEAVTGAVMSLENAPATNAGYGSNLTLNQTVECDAGIMDGNNLKFAAVGAVEGVKNPVHLAHRILEEQVKGKLSFGRIPPSFLVGKGATDWASEHGIPLIDKQDLICEQALKSYTNHKRKIDKLEEQRKKRRREECEPQKITNGIHTESDLINHAEGASTMTTPLGTMRAPRAPLDTVGDPLDTVVDPLDTIGHPLDTVGAVCIDGQGNIASAVSSGGIALKHPGRIGQAAIFACGCWAQNESHGTSPGVGCSTSGCGEHLVYTQLAKECCTAVQKHEDSTMAVADTFKNHFLNSKFLKDETKKFGGAILVKCSCSENKDLDVEVTWAHTTDSMCLGYMTTSDNKPKVLVSRLPEGSQSGRSLAIEGRHLILR